MPIVHCPMCQQDTTIPESDRPLTVRCSECDHRFAAPPSIATAVEIIEEAPLATPAPPRRPQPAPAPRQQPSPPPRRAPAPAPEPEPPTAPVASGSPFDFDGPAHGGEGPLVSSQGERLRRQERQAMGGWLLLAAVLDFLPILGAIILALVVAFAPRVPPEVAGGGLLGAVVFSVVGLVLVLPIMIGAWTMSRSSSFGLSLTGAIFALVLGLLYGLFIVPAALAVLARNGGVAGVCFALAVIGLISVIAGIVSIVKLFKYAPKAKPKSQRRARRDDPDEEDERPRRRRRRDEDDEDDRRAPRRRAGRGRDDY